jgi:hypothetical protein
MKKKKKPLVSESRPGEMFQHTMGPMMDAAKQLFKKMKRKKK